MGTITLKITINQDTTTAILRLEGRLAGSWIPECEQALESLAPGLGPKKLCLDLRGLTFVDQNGAELLAEIYRKHRAEFLTNTPLTKYFAEQAVRTGNDPGKNSGGEMER